MSIGRPPLHVGTTGLWLACLQPGTPLWLDLAAAAAAFALFALETVAVQFLPRTAALSQRIAFGVAVALSLLLLAVPMHEALYEWMHPWREGDSLLVGFGGGPRLWEFGLLDAAIALAFGSIAAWWIPARITRWLQPLWTVATIGAWTLASA